MVAALILAAGRGERMGMPKALIVWRGERFLGRVARICRGAGCDPVVAVVRAGAAEVIAEAGRAGAQAVPNPDADAGMFTSVTCGLAALWGRGAPPESVVVFPVDHAAVEAATMRALCEVALPPEGVAVPVYGGRGGHPIRIGAAVAERLKGLAAGLTLREALRQAGAVRAEVAVADGRIHVNINTAADLAALGG